jgi:hypothetical protein
VYRSCLVILPIMRIGIKTRHGVKERVVSEARQFLVVFAYVWLLLAVLDLFRSVILSDANIIRVSRSSKHWPSQKFCSLRKKWGSEKGSRINR